MADLTRGALQDIDRYQLVDRDSIVQLLGEQDFAATVKCDDTKCLVNYGKKLRAQKILHGRHTKVGTTIVVTLKIVDVGTAGIDAVEVQKVPGPSRTS